MQMKHFETLRLATLPSHLLPMLPERRPFKDLPTDAICEFLDFARQFPESIGRLSSTLKAHTGLTVVCPSEYTILEAHIDLEDADSALEGWLIGLGFEPDHFLTLNPEIYRKCYTMKFEIDHLVVGLNARKKEIQNEMLKRLKLACDHIDSKTKFRAYAEAEVYTDRMKSRFLPFRNFDKAGLSESPLLDIDLVAASGSDHKVLDLHVKVPTARKGEAFSHVSWEAQSILVDHLLGVGFYEITSYAGNRILTLQFAKAKGVRSVFHSLTAWAAKFGGISSMNLETCMLFWQRSMISDQVSPVPQTWRLT